MKKTISFLIALVLVLGICPAFAAADDSPEGVSVYSPAEEYDFSMTFPLKNWTVQFDSQSSQYVVQNPDDATKIDQIRVYTQDLPVGVSLETVEASLSTMTLSELHVLPNGVFVHLHYSGQDRHRRSSRPVSFRRRGHPYPQREDGYRHLGRRYAPLLFLIALQSKHL